MQRSKVILLASLVLASGCVTDKLAVFEGNVLDDEEMKPYIGEYEIVAVTEDDGKKVPSEELKGFSLEISQIDDEYHFVYGESESTSSGRFVLSKIPDTKGNLLLFSSPEVKDSGEDSMTIKNVFFVAKREKNTVRLWLMLGDEPVVKEYPFTQNASKGGFKSKELKQFLKKHADEIVAKNPAQITFKKK